jgi:hypothetical protein
MYTDPPAVLAEVPAFSAILPPSPFDPDPTNTYIEPLPSAAPPVPIIRRPEAPPAVEPVLSTIDPLAPVRPPDGVIMFKLPLLVEIPDPLEM